jgi:hypothetical protein
MKSAKEAEVVGVRCHEDGLPEIADFSLKEDGPTFYYNPPTNESFGGGPDRVEDPYERKWLQVFKHS